MCNFRAYNSKYKQNLCCKKEASRKETKLVFFLCSLKETKLVFFLSSLYCKEFKKEIKWAYFSQRNNFGGSPIFLGISK